MTARMSTAEAAQFRIRALLWWGGGLFAAGLAFRLVVLRTVVTGSSDPTEAAAVALAGAVVALVGLGLLVVGLGAVAVRLGLTAHGVPPSVEGALQAPATEHHDR